jgi:hypothetical protein
VSDRADQRPDVDLVLHGVRDDVGRRRRRLALRLLTRSPRLWPRATRTPGRPLRACPPTPRANRTCCTSSAATDVPDRNRTYCAGASAPHFSRELLGTRGSAYGHVEASTQRDADSAGRALESRPGLARTRRRYHGKRARPMGSPQADVSAGISVTGEGRAGAGPRRLCTRISSLWTSPRTGACRGRRPGPPESGLRGGYRGLRTVGPLGVVPPVQSGTCSR